MYKKKLETYFVIMEFYGTDENTGEYRLLTGVRDFNNMYVAKAFYEHVVETTEELMARGSKSYVPYERITFMRGGRLIRVWRRKLVGHYYSRGN